MHEASGPAKRMRYHSNFLYLTLMQVRHKEQERNVALGRDPNSLGVTDPHFGRYHYSAE